MAVTENSYTGNGSTTNYSFTFPYLKSTDVQVQVDATVTTAWQFANATTVQFNTAPSNGAKIKILRDTNVDSLAATFYAGSAIKSEDLNDNYTQNLYKTQEVGNRYFSTTGGTMTGDLTLGEDVTLTFEGATDNANETKLTVVDPTADRTITFPDTTGTVVTTGDTGTVATGMIAADAVNGTKIADDSINSEHYVDGSIDTQHIGNSQVTTAKIADNNVTTAKIVDANVTTAKIADNAVTMAKLNSGALPTDITVASANLVDGTIATADIADNAVTMAKLNSGALPTDITVASANLVNGTVATADIADDAITTAKIGAGAIGTTELNTGAITTAKLADDAVTNAKVGAGAIGTTELDTGAITTAKLAADSVTNAKIGAGAVGTTELDTGAITSAKLSSNSVISSKITDANVTTVKIADSNVTLAKLASDLKQTTISDSDTQLPTSGAVVDYVAAQIAPLGGLEVVATEVAFPNTQPSSGVVISISDAGGVVVNGSGVSTTGRTVGGTTVTINGFPSSLQSETLAAGVGLMVSSTGSSQTYNYHKILGKESDIKQLSDDINDFAERYRVSSSAPTSALDNGDLWFDTTNGKMMVYNGTNTAWEEVSAIGSFNINTLSSSGSTGGGSATFNGTAYRFTLSNPPQDAQQLLVSVNGVVQKPNSGTSQPSEGFAISGNDIIFSAAPDSGAPFFIVTLGQSVQIGTPSDGSVSTAKLASGAVTTAKIADDAVDGTKLAAAAVNTAAIGNLAATTEKINNAAITTAKIADGAVTAAKLASGAADLLADTSPQLGGNLQTNNNYISFADNTSGDQNKALFGNSGDLKIYHTGSGSRIENSTGTFSISNAANEIQINKDTSEYMARFITDGAVELYYDNAKKLETNASGVRVVGTLNTGNGATISFSDNVNLEDSTATQNNRIKLGGGDDLHIYHDGTDSLLKQFTATPLKIQGVGSNGADVHIQARPDEEGIKLLNNSGASLVELYYDNSKKFQTESFGAKIFSQSGECGLQIQGGEDSGAYLQLHADDGDDNADYSRIFHSANGTVYFQNYTSGSWETNIRTIGNGGVEAYYDNGKKFETFTNGIKVIGPSVDAGGGAASGNIQMLHTDGRKNTFGNHFASNAYDSRIEIGISDSSTSGGTNRVASFSYAGLSFGTDTAGANRLDDYEEGSWTPVLEGTTTTGTVTYVARVGKYVKIGKLVTWEFYISFNSGNGSGTFHITGLPYTVSNNGTYPAVNIGYVQSFSLRSDHHLYGLHASNSNYIYFYELPDGGGTNVQPNYDGSGALIMSGHYEVG